MLLSKNAIALLKNVMNLIPLYSWKNITFQNPFLPQFVVWLRVCVPNTYIISIKQYQWILTSFENLHFFYMQLYLYNFTIIGNTEVHTCSNAVVCLVWWNVVDAMVFPWQHEMPILEQRDPEWEAEVGVAPLMNLIGQRHENCQGKDVAVPGIGRRQGLWKLTGQDTPQRTMGRDRLVTDKNKQRNRE